MGPEPDMTPNNPSGFLPGRDSRLNGPTIGQSRSYSGSGVRAPN